jgi:hypothetical protein
LFCKQYHGWYLMFMFILHWVPRFYICITYSTWNGTLICYFKQYPFFNNFCQQVYIRAQILDTSYMFQLIPLFCKQYYGWYLMFMFISHWVPRFYICITYSYLKGTLICYFKQYPFFNNFCQQVYIRAKILDILYMS